MNSIKPSTNADYFLDITALVCPMTFVRTKLLIESMSPGQTCEIRLQGKEPLENVPRSAIELGHEIISVAKENTDEAEDGVHLLIIRKK
ncbi:MAG: sulfurtransferase TusA family protein [Rhodospirillaceae bacterium]|nr:sulfurtransferase TusA family protein [Rhodospirillaceae bacterium]